MREEVLDIFEQTTGGRIIHSVNRIGGVKRDMSDAELAAILARLEELGRDYKTATRVFATDPSIAHRLGGVGVLTAEDARAVDAVGPMARASGVVMDTRLTGTHLYGQLDFEPVIETAGDCLARVLVRMREVEQSIDLIRQAIAKMPKGEGLPLENRPRGNPQGEAFTRLEQPRGEVIYYVKANGTKNLQRFRVRTPTFANLPAMVRMLKGASIADVPNIILTVDPCISCIER